MNTIDIKKIEKAVIDWFQENEESRGIILPDGWFGRPYDYLLTLVEISSSDDVLNISLSDDFSFKLENPVSCCTKFIEPEDKIPALAIECSGPITFVWHSSSNGERREQYYPSGEIQFVPPPYIDPNF
jgi:hypothetical protein